MISWRPARALEVGLLRPEQTALQIAAGDGFLAFADPIVRDADGNPAFIPDHLFGDDPEQVKAGPRDPLRGCSTSRTSTGCCWPTAIARPAAGAPTRALGQWTSAGIPTGTR